MMACRSRVGEANAEDIIGAYVTISCPLGSQASSCKTCRNGMTMWADSTNTPFDVARHEAETEMRSRMYQHIGAVHEEVNDDEAEHLSNNAIIQDWGHKTRVIGARRGRSRSPAIQLKARENTDTNAAHKVIGMLSSSASSQDAGKTSLKSVRDIDIKSTPSHVLRELCDLADAELTIRKHSQKGRN